jgi:hypothetical protein
MNYPLHALPTEVQEAVQAVSNLTGVPIDAVASAALAVMSYSVQPHYDVQTLWDDTQSIPVSLFMVMIFASGGGKTTIFNLLTEGRKRWVEKAEEQYQADFIIYGAATEVWNLDRKSIIADKALSSPARTQALANHETVKPVCPPNPDAFLSSFTTAGLIDRLSSISPNVGIFTSEAGELFKSHSAVSTNGAEVELASALTNLWDGNPIKKMTLSGGAKNVRDRRTSACLMVQEEVVRDFFGHRDLAGQGIHGRMIVTRLPVCEQLENDLSDIGLARKAAQRKKLASFNAKVEGWVSRPLPTIPDDQYRLAPAILEWKNLSPSNPVNRWYNAAGRLLNSTHTGAQAFLKRVFENATRLAGVIAAFKGESRISDDTARAAVELMEYYIDQRVGLDLGQAASKQNDLLAQTQFIQNWFAAQKLKGQTSFSMRDMSNKISASVWKELNAEVKAKVLKGLCEDEVIKMDKVIVGNGSEQIRYGYLL